MGCPRPSTPRSWSIWRTFATGRRRISRATGPHPGARATRPPAQQLSWDLPIIEQEAGNPTEVPRVMGHEGHLVNQSDGSDLHVVGADRQAVSLKRSKARTESAVVLGCTMTTTSH